MKRKFDDEYEICGDSELLAKFYGYEIVKGENFNIFRLENVSDERSLDCRHEIFICDIPSTFTVEKLLLLLLKTKNLEALKIIRIQNKCFAFAEFSTGTKIEYTCDLLRNYEDKVCKIRARKCRLINTIYIANIKIRKINFYSLQLNILRTLCGIKRITFYSIDKYRRYSLIIDFFENCDTELGFELLSNSDSLFKNYPEVIVDVKCRIAFRNEPAVVYEWKKPEDSRRARPEITVLNTVEARNLQMF